MVGLGSGAQKTAVVGGTGAGHSGEKAACALTNEVFVFGFGGRADWRIRRPWLVDSGWGPITQAPEVDSAAARRADGAVRGKRPRSGATSKAQLRAGQPVVVFHSKVACFNTLGTSSPAGSGESAAAPC
jgi:hypothetical protein